MTDDPTIGKDGKAYPLTVKQLRFIDEYLSTGNASEAYRRAFPGSEDWKPDALRVRACELAAKPKVAAEINRRRAISASKVAVTVDSLVEELDEISVAAREAGQHAAAVSAALGKAKLLGFMVDKVDQTVRQATAADHKPDLSDIKPSPDATWEPAPSETIQ